MKEEIANKINELDIFSYQERRIKEIVKKDDEYTKQVIKDYFIKKYPKKNIKFDFLDEEIVDEIIKLGIAEYQKRQALGGVKMENSIEEDIKIALDKFSDNKDIDSAILIVEKFILGNYILRGGRKNIVKDSLRYILSDYKKVLKEAKRYKNMYKAEHEIHLVRNEQLDRKENAVTKCNELIIENAKLKEENEELKQDRNNNYQMIALAQNEALGYMQGYEDGKKSKRSAVAYIVENQQYYILNKQIEHYKEYIKKLQKENDKLNIKLDDKEAEIQILKDDIKADDIEYKHVIEILKKENEEYSKQLDLDYVDKNYISKKKIEDTIEELKGKLEDISKRREKSKTKEEETVLWCLEIRTDERIKTLQELL